MEKSITLMELLELIVLFSLSVSLIGRIIQFSYLQSRAALFVRKIILILISSQILSWIMTVLFWKFWPFERDPMLGYFSIPTIIGEFIILSTTFFVFKKKLWA